jgi:hypothetical protein
LGQLSYAKALRGNVAGKTHDDGTHLVFRAAHQREAKPGDVSTISDVHANVHWFRVKSERVFFFKVGVYGFDSSNPCSGLDCVDPSARISREGDVLCAPKIDAATAYRKNGRWT